ncbi:MAG: HupE/UreJ family protein [Phenylobacterium sp.]|uniref:HupE/UreJ family protein n=1 Tax=Phenylobacterium sp. TaxID=1871053 RepID=UPI001A464278|nr:HupE/UreJ family protein [Phenylobacterium sp.]MBL8556808.1 HupE/UreJ family protein [Phenylobacterium sp.]
MSRILALLLLAAAFLWPAAAAAHEVRPALLQITEQSAGHWRVYWKQPAMGEVILSLKPQLSSGWLAARPAEEYAAPGFLVRTWDVRSPAPLDGQTLRIAGLERSITDVLVQVDLADGRRIETVVKPIQPTYRFALARAAAPAVPAYLKLGVEHILMGVDHLAFVLGLLLLVGPNRNLIKAVTAFTVAHSLTLAAAALGWVHVPSALVESLVALSIVFVAAELLRDGPSVTRRWPWLVAFIFGLLHGLAFAGALAEIGLPPRAVAASLLLFNIGVELGQLMFVAVAVAVMLALRRLKLPARARLIAPYAIGSFAAFWFIERVVVVFQ